VTQATTWAACRCGARIRSADANWQAIDGERPGDFWCPDGSLHWPARERPRCRPSLAGSCSGHGREGSDSPAEVLREAAARIRALAAGVPPSPWFLVESRVQSAISADRECLNVIASAAIPERARFMALWQPESAQAVADLLETVASYGPGPGESWDVARRALAVARAYLGSVPMDATERGACGCCGGTGWHKSGCGGGHHCQQCLSTGRYPPPEPSSYNKAAAARAYLYADGAVHAGLTESERFQAEEARDLLARFAASGRADEDIYSTERVLHDHARNLLALVDKIAPKGDGGA
jgi:hypothetical protein